MKAALGRFWVLFAGAAQQACIGGTSIIGTASEEVDASVDDAGALDADAHDAGTDTHYEPLCRTAACGSACSDCLRPPAPPCIGHCSMGICTTALPQCD